MSYESKADVAKALKGKQRWAYLSKLHPQTRRKIAYYLPPSISDCMEEEILAYRSHRNYERYYDGVKSKWEYVKQTYFHNTTCTCGESDFLTFTCHHNDPSIKEWDSFALFCRRNSLEKIEEHMKTCTIMCKNCHMILHNGNFEDRIKGYVGRHLEHKGSKKYTSWKNRVALLLLKQDRGCARCRYEDAGALIFHHRDSSTKHEKISRLAKISRTRLLKEIPKTCILCSNCHQTFHTTYGLYTTEKELTDYLGYIPPVVKLGSHYFEERIPELLETYGEPCL